MGRPRTSDQPRNPWAVKIGARIKGARQAKKWKLRELALHAGLEVGRLGMYESGSRMPGPAEISAIAKATGELAAWLMGLTDDKAPDYARNSEEAALLEVYRTVDPPDRKKALDRLGALALLKKEAIEDAQLEQQGYSARGKPLVDSHGEPMSAPSGRGKAKRRGKVRISEDQPLPRDPEE